MLEDNFPANDETRLESGVETTEKGIKQKTGPDFSKAPCNGGTPNITAIGAKYIPSCGRFCSPQFYDGCNACQKHNGYQEHK